MYKIVFDGYGETEWRKLQRLFHPKPGDFRHMKVKISGKVYSCYSKEFEIAYNQEQAWSILRGV